MVGRKVSIQKIKKTARFNLLGKFCECGRWHGNNGDADDDAGITWLRGFGDFRPEHTSQIHPLCHT